MRKSIGYQAFNLYAFAMLKRQLPDHPFWHGGELQRAVDYVLGERWAQELDGNPYGYPYNPPGFEIPVALAALADLPAPRLMELTRLWVERQLDRTLQESVPVLGRNNPDAITLTARLYEATRFEEGLFSTLQLNVRDIRHAS